MDTLIKIFIESNAYIAFDAQMMCKPKDLKETPSDAVARLDLMDDEDIIEQLCEEGSSIVSMRLTLTKKTYTRRMARLLLEAALMPFKSVVKEHPRKRYFDIQIILFAADLNFTPPSERTTDEPEMTTEELTEDLAEELTEDLAKELAEEHIVRIPDIRTTNERLNDRATTISSLLEILEQAEETMSE